MQNESVFLHGWGMNQNVWQLLLTDLKSEISNPIKTLDLPGFGNSKSCPEPYTFSSVAKKIAEQLSDNSTLVGWSLGGLFAIHIAKYYPEKVSKIILVASSPFFTQNNNWLGIKPDVLQNFMSQLTENSSKTIERFLAIQAMGSPSAKQDIKKLKHILKLSPEPKSIALNAGLNFLLTEDLRPLFTELTIPIYGIFGGLDSLVPIQAVTNMTQLNSNFKAHVFPKASHAPFISHKNEFIQVLKEIL
ncbi:pimeloyl-ACP methyl ester esterase BioH [Pseudoalteromonas denitrificans]|uniref:Pimeloyl-[acyl-carrier protein] methyl ester esterase n=1 Tax=Pseudoalteromonas denitrificans DSM 6059 TaxID=1123010 RepID=A0A1I1QHR7_9GAMM|nr:pimeloyl-ACP methyl ester esterase BioH [Pseudoalteromonas denitrificans]SFD21694.1 pimeloyl-[acyl-carrier protein] methyl ester esterase [Pseudoalteromonas denitrificans DSM 6059]